MILPFFSYTTHIHRTPPHQPQRWERGLDLWLNCFSTTLLIILQRRQRIPPSFWTMRRSQGWILVLWFNSLEYHLPNPRTLLLPKSNLTYVSFSFSVSDIFFLKKRIGDLRFRLPEPVEFYTGHHLATTFGPACAQQTLRIPAFPPQVPKEAIDTLKRVIRVSLESEDCEWCFFSLNLIFLVWWERWTTLSLLNALTNMLHVKVWQSMWSCLGIGVLRMKSCLLWW